MPITQLTEKTIWHTNSLVPSNFSWQNTLNPTVSAWAASPEQDYLNVVFP